MYATDLSPSSGETVTDPLVFSWTGVGAGYTYSVELNDAQGNQIWNAYELTTTSVSYDGPDLTPGMTYSYRVVVEDGYGNGSFADVNFVYQVASVEKGNINNDGNVDLADAILALQMLIGLDPDGIHLEADVNEDGKIGLAEVIYILQYIAGLM